MVTYPGLDVAGDEGGLHLGDRVVDGHARAFLQDLDPEDLHAGNSAVFVGAGQRDVEGRDLIGVPGQSFGLEARDGVETLAAELVDGGAVGQAVGADECRVEDRALRQEDVLVGLELGMNVVDVGDEGAAQLLHQGEQGMTAEVDPDQRSGEKIPALLFGARRRAI